MGTQDGRRLSGDVQQAWRGCDCARQLELPAAILQFTQLVQARQDVVADDGHCRRVPRARLHNWLR